MVSSRLPLTFVDQFQNVVFQRFIRSGKSHLGCALAKQACLKMIRTYYLRMPDLDEEWRQAEDKPLGQSNFFKKYGGFSLLIVDEWWLVDPPKGAFLRMLLELMERRYGSTATVFCTQYKQPDWDARLGSEVHADAIMDRIVHNTIWVEPGS